MTNGAYATIIIIVTIDIIVRLYMEYMTIKEAAELWGLSIRRTQVLCETNRIEGVEKFGKAWAIPRGTPKPIDGRVKSGKYVSWRNKSSQK